MKKILFVAFAALMLTACGSKSSDAQAGDEQTNEVTDEETTAEESSEEGNYVDNKIALIEKYTAEMQKVETKSEHHSVKDGLTTALANYSHSNTKAYKDYKENSTPAQRQADAKRVDAAHVKFRKLASKKWQEIYSKSHKK